MNNNKTLLIIVLTVLATAVVFFVISKKVLPLVNPASPTPSASLLNSPKEIRYDSSTDLQKELDSVNPQVLDSDFGT